MYVYNIISPLTASQMNLLGDNFYKYEGFRIKTNLKTRVCIQTFRNKDFYMNLTEGYFKLYIKVKLQKLTPTYHYIFF